MGLLGMMKKAVNDDELHLRLAATMGAMERTGNAMIQGNRRNYISGLERTTLEHKREEAGHANLLFGIAKKLGETGQFDLDKCILAPEATNSYLRDIEARVVTYLLNQQRNLRFNKAEFRTAVYLLTTYAIEKMAIKVYPAYQEALDSAKKGFDVQKIIFEEDKHLKMIKGYMQGLLPNWQVHAAEAVKTANEVHDRWVAAIGKELGYYPKSAYSN